MKKTFIIAEAGVNHNGNLGGPRIGMPSASRPCLHPGRRRPSTGRLAEISGVRKPRVSKRIVNRNDLRYQGNPEIGGDIRMY